MKKSTILVLGFFGLAMIDAFIGMNFPIDYSYVESSVVPHFCLIGTLIYLKDKDWLDRLLIGGVIGILFDCFFTNTFPKNCFLFALLAFGIGFLNPYIQTRKKACITFVIFALLYDFIPFGFTRFTHPEYMPFPVWARQLELYSVVLSIITALILMYIKEVMSRYFSIREKRKKIKEKRRNKKARV